MDADSKYVLRKVVLDVVCLFIVGFPILLFFLFGQPFERGFYCDDESLRYPYKDSTISSTVLYVVGIFIPILSAFSSYFEIFTFLGCFMVLIGSLFPTFWDNMLVPNINNKILTKHCAAPQNAGHLNCTLAEVNIHPWVWNCYKVIGVFGFGMACSQLTTDIAKYTIGRLRPHFFAVCVPDIDCSKEEFRYRYIENFKCKSTDTPRLKDMRLSFPSGHSSFSAYTMIYLVIYLQARFVWGGSKLLCHFLQYVCFMMAMGTALSRISDYKHHWSDVLVGSLQGSLVAVLVAAFVSDLFYSRQPGSPAVIDGDGDPPSQSGNGGVNRIC